jgi:hypothetical protein
MYVLLFLKLALRRRSQFYLIFGVADFVHVISCLFCPSLKLVGARGFVKNWPIRGSESTCTFFVGLFTKPFTIYFKNGLLLILSLKFFHKNIHLCVTARGLDGVNNLHCVQLT